MSVPESNEQGKFAEDGTIEFGPLTWDGEPLYSVHTVREGLFDADAFHQFRGQMALEQDNETL